MNEFDTTFNTDIITTKEDLMQELLRLTGSPHDEAQIAADAHHAQYIKDVGAFDEARNIKVQPAQDRAQEAITPIRNTYLRKVKEIQKRANAKCNKLEAEYNNTFAMIEKRLQEETADADAEYNELVAPFYGPYNDKLQAIVDERNAILAPINAQFEELKKQFGFDFEEDNV